VALLFGPEDRGLANHELDQCNLLVRIPAGHAYPVMNLAAAVMVAVYELRAAGDAAASHDSGEPRATVGELERLYALFNQVLVKVRFLGRREHQGMITLRGILGRVGLQAREHKFLMGALRHILRFTTETRRDGQRSTEKNKPQS
jgi:TrmH family RNA methyltransferase